MCTGAGGFMEPTIQQSTPSYLYDVHREHGQEELKRESKKSGKCQVILKRNEREKNIFEKFREEMKEIKSWKDENKSKMQQIKEK